MSSSIVYTIKNMSTHLCSQTMVGFFFLEKLTKNHRNISWHAHHIFRQLFDYFSTISRHIFANILMINNGIKDNVYDKEHVNRPLPSNHGRKLVEKNWQKTSKSKLARESYFSTIFNGFSTSIISRWAFDNFLTCYRHFIDVFLIVYWKIFTIFSQTLIR